MAASEQLQSAHQNRVSGQYDEAIELYRAIISSEADASEAWWGLGLSLMNTGEFDEAIEVLTHATELDPQSPKYLLDLGKLQTMLGMFDEAKPVFEKVVELAPGSKESDEASNQLRYY
ncbi:MAG: tetratricopeptide repeat protein [Armatimonadetes bacterium]|nr:tetratricopeptide repeat protein [Armatimonadota bacterium]